MQARNSASSETIRATTMRVTCTSSYRRLIDTIRSLQYRISRSNQPGAPSIPASIDPGIVDRHVPKLQYLQRWSRSKPHSWFDEQMRPHVNPFVLAGGGAGCSESQAKSSTKAMTNRMRRV